MTTHTQNTEALDAQVDQVAAVLEAHAEAEGSNTFQDTALSNADVQIKAAPGNLYAVIAANKDGADVWIQFFDDLIANITVGSTVPKFSVRVPTGGENNVVLPVPLSFYTGMAMACTTSETNGTAPGTAAVVGIAYK